MIRTETFKTLEIRSAIELRDWLLAHHLQRESIWLVTFKKNAGMSYTPMESILDELVCFGWTEGVRRKLDDTRTMQLVSPRRTERWAKTYKDRALRMQKEGRMHSAGIAAIAAAKTSGLWNANRDVDALIVPADLNRSLAEHPAALRHFLESAPSYRRNVLRWIALARASETRARRIAKTTAFALKNEKLPHM
jgi:uncharacterized protein YdeI (YjbR/CyaY-like superfamily)